MGCPIESLWKCCAELASQKTFSGLWESLPLRDPELKGDHLLAPLPRTVPKMVENLSGQSKRSIRFGQRNRGVGVGVGVLS